MLNVKVAKRYSMDEVLSHPYFTGDYAKLSKLFTGNSYGIM